MHIGHRQTYCFTEPNSRRLMRCSNA
jgi:hypothetical protein